MAGGGHLFLIHCLFGLEMAMLPFYVHLTPACEERKSIEIPQSLYE